MVMQVPSVWLVWFAAWAVGCGHSTAATERSEQSSAPSVERAAPIPAPEAESGAAAVVVEHAKDWIAPYPRARWRLGSPQPLERTVLWVSHILIRHRDVPPSVISFRPSFWYAAPPAPDR